MSPNSSRNASSYASPNASSSPGPQQAPDDRLYVARCQLRAAKRAERRARDLLRIAEGATRDAARDAVSIAEARTRDARRVVNRLINRN